MIQGSSMKSSEFKRKEEAMISKMKEKLKLEIAERVSELQRITELKNEGQKITTDKIKRSTADNVYCLGGGKSLKKGESQGSKTRPKSSYLGS